MLQIMLHLCESEKLDLDMTLNVKKLVCMRFGSRFNATCANLTTLGGDLLAWVGMSLSQRLLFECYNVEMLF